MADEGENQGPLVELPDELLPGPRLGAAFQGELRQVELHHIQLSRQVQGRQDLGIPQKEELVQILIRGIAQIVGHQQHPALPGTGFGLAVVVNQLVHHALGFGRALHGQPADRQIRQLIVALYPHVPLVVGAFTVLQRRDPVTQTGAGIVLVVVRPVPEEHHEEGRRIPVCHGVVHKIADGRRVEQTAGKLVVEVLDIDHGRLQGRAEPVVLAAPRGQPFRRSAELRMGDDQVVGATTLDSQVPGGIQRDPDRPLPARGTGRQVVSRRLAGPILEDHGAGCGVIGEIDDLGQISRDLEDPRPFLGKPGEVEFCHPFRDRRGKDQFPTPGRELAAVFQLVPVQAGELGILVH